MIFCVEKREHYGKLKRQVFNLYVEKIAELKKFKE